MKAISLWQPWAALMAVGAKKVETRHWPTRYRGLLAIHAARRRVDREFIENCREAEKALAGETIWYGAIVAVVCLYDVKRTERLIHESLGEDILFGDFGINRFGWLTRDVRKLQEPVATRGFQSIWTLPRDIELAVEKQILI